MAIEIKINNDYSPDGEKKARGLAKLMILFCIISFLSLICLNLFFEDISNIALINFHYFPIYGCIGFVSFYFLVKPTNKKTNTNSNSTTNEKIDSN